MLFLIVILFCYFIVESKYYINFRKRVFSEATVSVLSVNNCDRIIQRLINQGFHLRRIDGKLRLSLSLFLSSRAVALACDRFLSGEVFRTAGKIFARGYRDVVVGKLSASLSRPSDPDRINLKEQYVLYIRSDTSLTSSMADLSFTREENSQSLLPG